MNTILSFAAAFLIAAPNGRNVCSVTPPDYGADAVIETTNIDHCVAWRIRFGGNGERTIENEEWTFDFGADLKCWPVSHAQGEYVPKTLSTISSMRARPGYAPVAAGIGEMHNYATDYPGTAESPLVVEGADFVVAIGDAGVLDYARIRFASGAKPGQVKTILEGKATVSQPYVTPWRYIHVAKDAASLANAQPAVMDALNEPSRIADTSWIKPGKVLRVAKLTTDCARAAVDFVRRNNMQYIELDCGWYGQEHTGDPLKPGLAPDKVARGEIFDLLEILAYAKEKDVGVVLYVNREPLKKNRDAILDQLVAWGVKGVKYGFVNVGDQKWRKWVTDAIAAAAERKLLVDIHDEYRLTGIQKTYPNVMTVEGIHGNEEMPNAAHDCALPFTRFLDGPGDYTPCWRNARVKNTLAHQLALPCVYASGWQFLFWYSRPDQIDEKNPALDFWREIPCAFDETRFLQGEIGKCAIVARRAGKKWFVGCINGLERRSFEVPLDFAGGGEFSVRVFADADPALSEGQGKVAVSTRRMKAGETLRVECAARGGFAAIVERVDVAGKGDRLSRFAAEGSRSLADRLLMYWKSHATDVFVRNESVERVGGDRAPEPTVMFAGNRSHVTAFRRPMIEDLPLRAEDERGLFLEPADGGERTWASYGKTGCMISSINREIVTLARDAARRWKETEDEAYACLALEVLDTYLGGIYYRNVPTDLGHGHLQTLFGMQSMETIHDDVIHEATELYALIKPYAEKARPERLALYKSALRKWADVQIENGVADNNWDMMQLNYILDIALVLDEPDRSHYIDVCFNRSSVRNLSIRDLAERGFDKTSGTWWECPGYSVQVTLKDFARFADRSKAELGIDLVKEIPVLQTAFDAAGEYLFPDGMLIGFGDTHPGPLPEDVKRYAKNPHVSPFFHAPNASWLVARSGMDPTNDVAFALNASLGNHQHANGISMELYARGYRLAPDAGVGWQLYSGDDYKEYYSQFPAHNTVMVNSRSTYQTMKSYHPFELVQHGDNWATVRFREPATGAEQERTVRYVKDAEGAYFVDVFRSRILGNGERGMGNGEQWHDYYYHNFGDSLELNGEVEPTEIIAFQESGLPCLSYIQEKFARKGKGDLVATFDWKRPEGNVRTRLFMNDAEGRTFVRALAPATEGLSRVKSPNYGITRDSRTPCLVVRQRGEAWTRPFVAIVDPTGTVKSVEFRQNEIRVVRSNGAVDILPLDCPQVGVVGRRLSLVEYRHENAHVASPGCLASSAARGGCAARPPQTR